jgi:glutaconate CoA-transferase subunit B
MAVGDYQQPQVRLPGGAGSAILAYVVERVVLFKTTHEPRGLVPKVDVVTAPGYTPRLSPRQHPGTVTCLITPKCVFGFSPPAPPVLQSLHPGVTLEEVRQLTGFEFQAPSKLPATPALSPEALELLYGPVQEKLARVYPQFALRLLAREG